MPAGPPPGRLRTSLQQRLRQACLQRCQPLEALADSALVVAPHPDDETLGCGGTLARKLAQGAAVEVAVLTDGSASHARFLSRDQLSSRRKQELREAAATLGLSEASVHWLGLPDGELSNRLPAAVAALRPIIERLQPRQLFLPCRQDQLDDHLAARQAGLEAARLAGQSPLILGYPVWFWNHWPWFRHNALAANGPVSAMQRAVRGWTALLRDFRVRVDLDPQTLATKRAALACHRSQLQRPADKPDWPLLADVAEGDFLRCLLREVEIFTRETRSGY